MYYFLNNRLDANSSGIEHAEVKRLKLFKKNGVRAKLVMSEFNRFAHSTLPLYGLSDGDYVNMFDFFAGTVNFPARVATLEDLALPSTSQVQAGANSYEVCDGGRKTMTITMFASG
ncbi:poly(glycerol-phosphate) alpha-glucosyltransferase, partial [Lactobacillus sp. XV13L]|nr:poly(glycerol-phosphate) alpha-glucosyltransferase [Lactobacillus sp. XV13L]